MTKSRSLANRAQDFVSILDFGAIADGATDAGAPLTAAISAIQPGGVMNLNYSQRTGKITTDEGDLVTTGWAGHGDGKNNPGYEDVVCTGPLPKGLYWVQPWEPQHPGLGPMVAYLKPDHINEMHGRGSFYIHGPSMDKARYGQESKGCIVIPRIGRDAVRFLTPTTITVTE